MAEIEVIWENDLREEFCLGVDYTYLYSKGVCTGPWEDSYPESSFLDWHLTYTFPSLEDGIPLELSEAIGDEDSEIYQKIDQACIDDYWEGRDD